jgi:hypothetical protein
MFVARKVPKHLKNIHPNMRFSMKMEENSIQSYFHVMINRKLDGPLEQSVNRDSHIY